MGLVSDARGEAAQQCASAAAAGMADNRVHTAGTFLMEHTIDVLVRWSKCENLPVPFTIIRTGSRIEFRHRDEVWRGPLGYMVVELVP